MNEHKYGNAGPMGLLAFASSSFVLGVYHAGLLPSTGMPLVLAMALLYGGLIQVICAILEIISGNTFVATVFGTYGSFWTTYGVFSVWFAPMIPKAEVPSAVALFLAMFTVVTVFFLICSLKTNKVLITIFVLVLIMLVFSTLGNALRMEELGIIAGWLTMIFAVLTWYLAASQVTSAVWGREILPLGHIKQQ